MAKKKYEFRPDEEGTSLFSRLYMTPRQRKTLLKWTLYALVLLLLSLVQDVILSRFRIFGTTTDLVSCAVLLICVIQGSESCSIFALVAAALYQFSGGPGYFVIVLLPLLGILAAMFRQGYLHKTVASELLCTFFALFLYELSLFLVCLVLERTAPGKIGAYLITAALTAVTIPVLYPICNAINKLGGEV